MVISVVVNAFGQNSNIIGWRDALIVDDETIDAWKPEPLDHGSWPPNYRAVYLWRIKTLRQLRSNPALITSAKAYYRTRPAEFIMHWMDTYDPRKSGNKWVPFVFFKRQDDLIAFINDCANSNEGGLVEKCRDAGATWLAVGYSVHSWLFIENDAIGWGSRKQDLVDLLGDPSSIFEKMRLVIRRLPDIFKPQGLVEKKHLTFMKCVNPENNSVITGEAGDNIGRGGRTRIYFKDESAHYERPEKIEAALGDNTNCQIDISSVNGLGNAFYNRRQAGVEWQRGVRSPEGFTRVFIMDWRDHPAKTQEWFNLRRAKYEREGMLHLFAQEVERNYSAALSNTIIDALWLNECIDAHKRFKWKDDEGRLQIGIPEEKIPRIFGGGLDVADGGIDRNASCLRQWVIWRYSEEWGERDPGVSTRRAIARFRPYRGISVQYDNIGIGASVKSEFNRLIDEKIITANDIKMIGWNAGAAVANPFDRVIADDDESALNKDFFGNMKAQAWWSMRTRCYKTYKNITEGVLYPLDELISLDSANPLLHQTIKELAQVTRGQASGLQMIIDKQPKGTKSPNVADAGVMAFFPVVETGTVLVGSYGL